MTNKALRWIEEIGVSKVEKPEKVAKKELKTNDLDSVKLGISDFADLYPARKKNPIKWEDQVVIC